MCHRHGAGLRSETVAWNVSFVFHIELKSEGKKRTTIRDCFRTRPRGAAAVWHTTPHASGEWVGLKSVREISWSLLAPQANKYCTGKPFLLSARSVGRSAGWPTANCVIDGCTACCAPEIPILCIKSWYLESLTGVNCYLRHPSIPPLSAHLGNMLSPLSPQSSLMIPRDIFIREPY